MLMLFDLSEINVSEKNNKQRIFKKEAGIVISLYLTGYRIDNVSWAERLLYGPITTKLKQGKKHYLYHQNMRRSNYL